MKRGGPGWVVRALLRLSLLAWPAKARARDGAPLIAAVEEDLVRRTDGPGVGTAGVLLECATIAGSGLAMRWREVLRVTGGGATGWMGDVRYAARTLARSPGFTLAVTLTLALGIGANAAVFGLVRGVLLTPPDFEDPDRLVLVWNTLGESPARFRVAATDVAELRARVPSLGSVAFMNRVTDGAIEAEDGSGAEHVRLALVTDDLFDVLGVEPASGRGFEPADAEPPVPDAVGRAAPILLSDGLWKSAFGADPGVLGRVVRLNGSAATVIGIMPADFRIPLPPDVGVAADADVWIPLRVPLTAFARGDGRQIDQDSDNTGAVVARLRSGADLGDLGIDLARLAADMRAEIPAYGAAEVGLVARGLQDDATRHVRSLLTALLAGAALVLLISCLNLSILVLARGARRRPELSVRAALGAGRMRIVRQQLTETGVLALLGTALSLVVAGWISRALEAWGPAELAPAGGFRVDAPMLLLAAGAAILATALAGALPALRVLAGGERAGLAGGLRADGPRERSLRSAMMVAQVALSVVLVLGCGLLVRTVHALRSVDPGFEPAGALTFSVSLRTPERYRGPADRALLMREIEAALAEEPGVRAVGLTTQLPLSGRRWTQPYGLPGQAPAEWAANRADFRSVTSGYFHAMGTRLLEGRTFTREEDLREDRRVVVIDERLARLVAPDGSALGLSLGIPVDGSRVEAEIVGVVERVRHESLETDGREALYVPYRQEASRDVSFVVRARGDPSELAVRVRERVRALDPQLPLYGLQPMEAYVDAHLAPVKLGFGVLSGFAVLAMLAVGIGLYGVVALEVRRRTRDLGLRMAVGATRAGVVRSVLATGLRLAAAGTCVGAVVAVLGSRAAAAVVYGTSIADPLPWAGALATVGLVTTLACLVPAVRASRLSPTVAMRAD